MKRLLLISVCLLIAIGITAQERALLPKERRNQAVKASIYDASISQHRDSEWSLPNKTTSMLEPNEQDIGNTLFDVQSNNLLQNRIYRYDDGSIGAVWTMGVENAPNFPDRGTGYNFYNGTEWGPNATLRIESIRTGWPSYGALGTDGEIIISHDYAIKQLLILTRETKGVGDWTESYYTYTPGPANMSHARMITAGADHNSIHLLANSWDDYGGQPRALLYSRSQDGGANWNIENEVLDGTGPEDYFNIQIDTYVWADERAGTIAFLSGTMWNDLFIMKSTDDGESWDKTIVWENPYPFFDFNTTITDTFFCCDRSASIALDSEGKAHVVFGIGRIIHPEIGGTFYLFADVDGIAYWNEDMDAFSNDLDALAPPGLGYENSEMVVDHNYIGWMQDVNGSGAIELNTDIFWYREIGLSTMPSITIDEDDRIFVIYSSTTETFEYENFNLKHLWGRAYENGFWGPFVDLTTGITHLFDECIYPQLAASSDQNIHYIYNQDQIPGLATNDNHEYVENSIIYAVCPKNDLLTGLVEDQYIPNARLQLDCYPNPSSGRLNIQYTVYMEQYTKLDVYTADGIKVKTLVQEYEQPGNYQRSIDISDLPSGLFFVLLQSGDQTETTKVILLK